MLLLLAPKIPPLFSSRSNFKWKISNQISKQLDVVYRSICRIESPFYLVSWKTTRDKSTVYIRRHRPNLDLHNYLVASIRVANDSVELFCKKSHSLNYIIARRKKEIIKKTAQ